MKQSTIQKLSPTSRRDLRALAFHLVYAVDRFDYVVSLKQVVSGFRRGFHVVIPDDSYAISLARGAIEEREKLDAFIRPLLKNWRLERLGCCTKLILRLALWELQQPDAIASVIINEAIELAKAFAEKDAYKFVNGVLDTLNKSGKLQKSGDEAA